MKRAGGSALALAQGLQDAGVRPASGLWLVTTGGQVIGAEASGQLCGSLLWGFGRTVARELGDLRVGLVDLDPDDEEAWAGRLAGELLCPDGETEVAWRSGRRLVSRLVRFSSRSGPVAASDRVVADRVRSDRSYLVTGGFGGMGLRVAGWLADRGVGAVVLNGRRPPDGVAEEAIRALRNRGHGVEVRVAVDDVSDGAAVARMLAKLEQSDLPPLAGVFHGAGVLSDGSLTNQDWERFERVLRPKALGAWHLHRATEGLDLDLFVLFSSASGILGSAGLTNYAAANTFLDQLAAHRRALGLAGQSIQWGAWFGVGMAKRHREQLARRLGAAGMEWLTPEQGLRALARLVLEDAGNIAVLSQDLSSFDRGGRPLLAELAPGRGEEARADSRDDLLTRLREAARPDRQEILLQFVRDEVRSVLRLPSRPSPEIGFFDLGVDSLMAVELRTRLSRALAGALVVPNTVIFDHPNPAKLARHLAAELGDAGDEKTKEKPRRVHRKPGPWGDERIAIVGMACRFPGGSDLSSFWRHLTSGGDAVTQGRPDGLTVNEEADPPAPQWGAYLAGLDRFDADFFRIAPVEADLLDPQQRLLLEASWEALEDAGLDPGSLKGSQSGVYVGISANDSRELATVELDAGRRLYQATGSSLSTAIGRVAFTLGLEGPAIAVDTACSSSLVAIHQAMAGLQRGETHLALAGGVHTIVATGMTRLMEASGMLSPDGRCRTFDASANGYVRGEGCGMLVLKRLSDAEANGDRILGVLLGSAVNQDGASAGLMVPKGQAQRQVIAQALERARVDPLQVDYLEAHGTATELGDQIEVQAAAEAYGVGRPADHPLLLGSVKTNIGHLETAAGVAGVVKVLLSMRAGMIPKHLHFQHPNPLLDWERLRVRVTSSAIPWPSSADHPPRAGVSAFGMAGTNAHLIVERYGPAGEDAGPPMDIVPETAAAAEPRPVARSVDPGSAVSEGPSGESPLAAREARLLPLSGRTGEALRQLASRYAAWLDSRSEELTPALLSDVAWTAGAGRSHFERRAGLVFEDEADLRAQLDALAGASAPARPASPRRVGFLFPDQGREWAGMGRDLYDREPVVRAVLDRCEAVFREERGASLLAMMFGDADPSGTSSSSRGDLDAMERTQPMLYALQVALVRLWSSVGVHPDAVLGDGVGQIAAAQTAGVFDLEAGMRLASRRGVSMGSLPARAESAVESTGSGVEPVRTHPDLAEVASSPGGPAPSIRLVSPVTGRVARPDEVLDDDHRRRRPGAFESGLRTLMELGVSVLVEIGPPPSAGRLVASCWPSSDGEGPAPVVLSSLAGRVRNGLHFVRAVASAYEAGVEIAFSGLFAGEQRRRLSLPTYPFQRKRHWFASPGRRPTVGDPLLGERRASARGEVIYETELRRSSPAWLKDHRLCGRPEAPAALFAAQAVTVSMREWSPGVPLVVSGLRLHDALVLPERESTRNDSESGRTVQVILGPSADASEPTRPIAVFSRGTFDDDWILHAEGRVRPGKLRSSQRTVALEALARDLQPASAPAFYHRMAESGIRYDWSFRTLSNLRLRAGESLAEVSPRAAMDDHGVAAHPVLLDGWTQVSAAAYPDSMSLVLAGWDRLWLGAALPDRHVCHFRRRSSRETGGGPAPDVRKGDLRLYTVSGLELGNLRLSSQIQRLPRRSNPSSAHR